MKVSKLLAGVAVASFAIAGAAQADDFNYGQSAGSATLGPWTISGQNSVGPNSTGFLGFGATGAGLGQAINGWAALLGAEEVASWISIEGGSEGNLGVANNTAGASFNLSGDVSQDCVFYTGSLGGSTIDFGTIGINTNDNAGVDVAFDMVDDAEATVETNVAGCNFSNTVRLSKTNMVNNTVTDFDNSQFTNELPLLVEASWTGVPLGAGASAGVPQSIDLAGNETQDQVEQGAWKSHFVIDVNIPAPSLSLVAGSYDGSLSVEIGAL